MINEKIRLIYPRPDQTQFLTEASGVIEPFAKQGMMIAKSVKDLESMAAKMHLLIATMEAKVVGTAGFTFMYENWQKKEYGSWAVAKEVQNHKVGLELIGSLLFKHPLYPTGPTDVMAVTNKKSGPIVSNLGALELPECMVDNEVFEACETCDCKGKENLQGNKCVDDFYDLSTVNASLIESKLGHPIRQGEWKQWFWKR